MNPRRLALQRTFQLWLSLYAALLLAYVITHAAKSNRPAAQQIQLRAMAEASVPSEPAAAIPTGTKTPASTGEDHPKPSSLRHESRNFAAEHSFRQDFSTLARRGKELEGRSKGRGQIDVEVDANYLEAARSFGARFVISSRIVSSVDDLNGSFEILGSGALAPFHASSAPDQEFVLRELGRGALPPYLLGAIERVTHLQGPGQNVFAVRPRNLFYAEVAAIDLQLFQYHALHLGDCQRALIFYARKDGDWAPQLKQYSR